MGHLVSGRRGLVAHSHRWVQDTYLIGLSGLLVLRTIESLWCLLISRLKWPSWEEVKASIKTANH